MDRYTTLPPYSNLYDVETLPLYNREHLLLVLTTSLIFLTLKRLYNRSLIRRCQHSRGILVTVLVRLLQSLPHQFFPLYGQRPPCQLPSQTLYLETLLMVLLPSFQTLKKSPLNCKATLRVAQAVISRNISAQLNVHVISAFRSKQRYFLEYRTLKSRRPLTLRIVRSGTPNITVLLRKSNGNKSSFIRQSRRS